ncbi:MAG: hypothetical protein ACLT8E_01255 [Akkermansia sp.]
MTPDGVATWTTVGVSYNIIEASLEALADAVTYKLYDGAGQMARGMLMDRLPGS